MANRITFKSLLQQIQKETGLDNKQSDRLIRQLFGILNEGLEENGRVRISKFGSFKLQKVAERKGINPITREALVIPAHTKVVFKGAKNLKETVNRKYNLLEAKSIIMPENKSEKKETSESKKNDKSGDKKNTEINNIMSKLTESEKSDNKELKYDEKTQSNKDSTKIEQLKKKQSDEVRKKIEEKFTNKNGDFTPTGVMASVKDNENKPEEKSDSADKQKQETKAVQQEKEPEKVEVIVNKEEVKDETKEKAKQTVPPIRENKEEKNSKVGLWIALVVILILLLFLIFFWKPWAESEEVVVDKPPVKQVVEPEPSVKPKVPKKVYKTPGGDHAVSRGDKLWDLSDEFYNDAYLWPNIYRVNDKDIKNPDILIIGNIVTIPPLEGTIRNLTTNDSVNISVGFLKAYKAYKKYGNEWAKYYLWVCKKYDQQTFLQNENSVDQEDFQFAKSMK